VTCFKVSGKALRDKAILYNNVSLILYSAGATSCATSDDVAHATFRLRMIRSPLVDPKYYADHGPLPRIYGHVIQQKYSINRFYHI